MSLESFYGGKQGISPVIKNSFQYVDTNDPAYLAAISAGASVSELASKTMDVMLSNSNYEDVWYNELCIIDTVNKNNKNNGKIYRRTLKGRGDTDLPNRSAEYLGQIVGPAGSNPSMVFGDLALINNKIHDDYSVNEDTYISWPNSASSISNVKPETGVNPYVFDGTAGNMLVPGKDGDTYNDNIKYTWFNILDNTTESPTQSIVYLGFEIPYPSLDITTTNVDWDEEVSSQKQSGVGYDEHPFYHSWKINIPRGVRGNAASNIRLAQYKDFKNVSGDSTKPWLYNFEDSVIEVNTQRGVFIVNQTTPPVFEALTEEEKVQRRNSFVWVYDYTFYDKPRTDDAQINTYTFYIGLYNEIADVTFDEDGTVTFIYSNTEKKEFNQIVKWIQDIQISTDGEITFIYNTGSFTYQVTGNTSFATDKVYYEKDEEDNYFITEDESYVEGKVYYEKVFENETYSEQLPYPDHLVINDNGTISLFVKQDNGYTSEILLQNSASDNFKLNYVNTLSIDEDTKVLSYTTTPQNFGEELNNGEGLNYIQAMTVNDDFHLVVYYGSSQFRPTETDVAAGTKDGDTLVITNNPDNTNTVIWRGQTFIDGIVYPGIAESAYWQDFGTIRQVAGTFKMATEFDLTDYPDLANLSDYSINRFITEVLNPHYWDTEQTIENPYYQGKIGTAADGTPLEGNFCYTLLIGNGSAYYYDYDDRSWKFAGTWGASTESDVKINTVSLGSKNLADTGILFLEKTSYDVVTPQDLPILWPTE